MKCVSWSYFLRFLIISGLFIVFANRFAWPSYNKYLDTWYKYLDAGVFIDRSSVRSENKDTPAITFCALNKETDRGWKSQTNVKKDIGTTWVDNYCNNKETLEDTVACMDDETFNITETLRDFEIDETELSRNFIHTDNDL